MSDVHSTSSFAAERYILGEMSAEERDVFEEHFFSCPECADNVQAAAAFVDNARAVLPEMDKVQAAKPEKARFRWFEWRFAPQAALACILLLTAFTGYQNGVQIPRLRAAAGPGANLVLFSAQPLSARRAASRLAFSVINPVAAVVIPHEWEEEYPRYAAEIRKDASGGAVLSSSEVPAGGSLVVSIPAARLGPGNYTMILSGVSLTGQKQTVGRYPFAVTE